MPKQNAIWSAQFLSSRSRGAEVNAYPPKGSFQACEPSATGLAGCLLSTKSIQALAALDAFSPAIMKLLSLTCYASAKASPLACPSPRAWAFDASSIRGHGPKAKRYIRKPFLDIPPAVQPLSLPSKLPQRTIFPRAPKVWAAKSETDSQQIFATPHPSSRSEG